MFVPLAAILAVVGNTSQNGFTAELVKLAAEDQTDRGFEGRGTAEQNARMKTHDRARQRRVHEILAMAKSLTAEGFSAAGLVFQHGESPDDFALAHELTLCAGALGTLSSLPALTEDRFLTSIHRLQRFGTQFSFVGKATKLDPADEGKATSVTNDLRLDYLVPPIKMSREKGLAAVTESRDLVFERIQLRRDPGHPLVGDPAVSLELEAMKPGRPAEAKVLALYAANRLTTDADFRLAARVLLGSSDPNAVLLAHELSALSLMEGDKASGSLVERSWAKFLSLVGRKSSAAFGDGLPRIDAVFAR